MSSSTVRPRYNSAPAWPPAGNACAKATTNAAQAGASHEVRHRPGTFNGILLARVESRSGPQGSLKHVVRFGSIPRHIHASFASTAVCHRGWEISGERKPSPLGEQA